MQKFKRTLLGLLLLCPLISTGQTLEVNVKTGVAMHDLFSDDLDIQETKQQAKFCGSITATAGFARGPRLGIGMSVFSASATSAAVYDSYGLVSKDAKFSYGPIIPVELYLLWRIQFGEKVDFDFGATGGISLTKRYKGAYADNPVLDYDMRDTSRTWFNFGCVFSLQYKINEMMAVGIEAQQRSQTIEKGSYLMYPIFAKFTVII